MKEECMASMGKPVAAAALVAAVVAVGCATKPGSTPEGAFAELQAAYAKGDHGAVFDMMAAPSRTAFADSVKKMAEQMKNMPPFAKQLVGFEFEELAKLPPRDAFAKMLAGVKGSAKLGSAISGKAAEGAARFAGARVKKCDVKGDAAVLALEMGGAESTLDLVREDGVWKFATPLAPKIGK